MWAQNTKNRWLWKAPSHTHTPLVLPNIMEVYLKGLASLTNAKISWSWTGVCIEVCLRTKTLSSGLWTLLSGTQYRIKLSRRHCPLIRAQFLPFLQNLCRLCDTIKQLNIKLQEVQFSHSSITSSCVRLNPSHLELQCIKSLLCPPSFP